MPNTLFFLLVELMLGWKKLKLEVSLLGIRVPSLGWEDLLEKEMAIHSSILAWRIPWTEGPAGLQSTGSQRVDMTERLN